MFGIQYMHHIQRDIINTLSRSSPMRFSDLQPSRIPNNTFSYHLKKLLDTGYIDATDKGYVATRKALKSISYTHHNDKRVSKATALITLFIKNQNDEILLVKRSAQPFKDWLTVPIGLIRDDETLPQAAGRELFDRMAVVPEIAALRMRGVLDFRYLENGTSETFMHGIGFIYAYTYTGDSSVIISKSSGDGELHWSTLDQPHILPEVQEIAEIVAEPAITIRSIDFEEPIL
jgi:ADP-ribose pyrophosphatase YjhB (NUDIX family)